jgi:phosphoserine phosphatase RsbX
MSSDSPRSRSHTDPARGAGALADLLDIGVAHRMLAGERKSGDAWVSAAFDGGILIGVIDGLGHGEEAAHPAELACATLRADPGADVVTLINSCHAALRDTRGAVMTLVQLHPPSPTMTWVAVGNVDGRLIRRRLRDDGSHHSEVVLLKGGVVGYRLPALSPRTHPVEPGDTLMLATDGVRPMALEEHFREPLSAQAHADSLLAAYGLETDDSLVLVARYRGPAPSAGR